MISHRPLALAGFVLLALPACATTPAPTSAEPTSALGIDLGPSSRVPTMQIAMAGAGREAHRGGAAASGNATLIHNDGTDAHATGTVNSVDPAQHKINLSHNPIPTIGWPAMTMDFAVAPSVDLSRIKPGSKVDFSMEKGKDGMYEVKSLQPAGATR